MNLVKCSEKEFSEIRNVLKISWLDTYTEFIPESNLINYLHKEYSDEKLSLLLNSGHTEFYLNYSGNNPEALLKISWETEKGTFFINSLYVLPQAQGKGLGRKLFEFAKMSARSHNCDEIWLGVMTKNEKAVNWYKHLGFEFVTKEPFSVDGIEVEHLLGFIKL